MDIINKDEWLLKEKPKMIDKSASKTFLVSKKIKKKNKHGENIEEEAILKIQRSPALAHEIIAYGLAKILDLQITDTQILPKENVKEIDQDGTISFRIPSPHDTWFNFPTLVKEQPHKYVKNYEEFALLFVFDVLIANPDRHERNLLLLDLLTGKVLFYIIDHGHALLGAGGNRWPSAVMDEAKNYVGRFGNIYKEIAKSNFTLFKAAINKVKTISSEKIDNIVDSVPRKYLPEEQAKVLKEGIKTRRDNIEKLIETWYTKDVLIVTKGGN